MGKTTVDVDALIAGNSLELTLKGKVYVVVDVPMESFLKATSVLDEEGEETGTAAHRQLAFMLGVEVDDIKDVGLRAAAVALTKIREWMIPEEEEEDEDSEEPSDP